MSDAVNQCMGCQAGWPTQEAKRHGPGATDVLLLHVTSYPNGGIEVVACTKGRYLSTATARSKP